MVEAEEDLAYKEDMAEKGQEAELLGRVQVEEEAAMAGGVLHWGRWRQVQVQA